MPSPPDPGRSFLPALPLGARVLVIRLRSLGDSVLLTPALRALKRWRPDLRVSVLLYRRFAPILASNPDVEEVLELDDVVATPLAAARALGEIRWRGFAACFNLHGGTLSALLTRLSGAPHRAGLCQYRFAWVYTLTADPRAWFQHERLHGVENQIALFYAAGLPLGDIPPLQLFPQPSARAAVEQELARRGVSRGARYAVLHPVANFFTKEWPFDRYAALARALETEHGLAPVFICGPGESAKLDAVARAYGKALVRVEAPAIPELVALLEGAALFVGNDSGPAHIASALGRPVVVLFGSSDSQAWGPWPRGEGLRAIVQNPSPCNPCRGDRCYAFAEPECILSITLDQTRAAVEKMLVNISAPAARGG